MLLSLFVPKHATSGTGSHSSGKVAPSILTKQILFYFVLLFCVDFFGRCQLSSGPLRSQISAKIHWHSKRKKMAFSYTEVCPSLLSVSSPQSCHNLTISNFQAVDCDHSSMSWFEMYFVPSGSIQSNLPVWGVALDRSPQHWRPWAVVILQTHRLVSQERLSPRAGTSIFIDLIPITPSGEWWF